MTPEDAALRVELVEAMVQAQDLRGAQAAAAGLEADPSSMDHELLVRFACALDDAGAGAIASPWLERALELGDADSARRLSIHAVASGDLGGAEDFARRAVARGGASAALAQLAHVLDLEGRSLEASESFAAAAALVAPESGLELLVRAIEVAPLGCPDELCRLADAIEELVPGHVSARWARARVALSLDQLSVAEPLCVGDSGGRAALVAAMVAAAAGRPGDVLVSLSRLSPDGELGAADQAESERLRRDALSALWRHDGEVDLPAAIDAVAQFAAERSIPELAGRAERLRDELDRPLLLAVLGEFNAGKSTFVNALIGADVAPTCILPTTATLNLLRGGAERRVRLVLVGGRSREGSLAELPRLLREAEGDGVDHVEIMIPSETLERVWILDTPGTNAPDQAHERLATEAMHRADASLWVFDAGQAGKRTEGDLVRLLCSQGQVVVPVLNKVDRLSARDQRAVIDSLRPVTSGLSVPLTAISARAALDAKLSSDATALVESGFPALMATLDEHVVGRSRNSSEAPSRVAWSSS